MEEAIDRETDRSTTNGGFLWEKKHIWRYIYLRMDIPNRSPVSLEGTPT